MENAPSQMESFLRIGKCFNVPSSANFCTLETVIESVNPYK